MFILIVLFSDPTTTYSLPRQTASGVVDAFDHILNYLTYQWMLVYKMNNRGPFTYFWLIKDRLASPATIDIDANIM